MTRRRARSRRPPSGDRVVMSCPDCDRQQTIQAADAVDAPPLCGRCGEPMHAVIQHARRPRD